MKSISVIFSIIGLGFLAGAICWYINEQKFISSAIITKGEVVEMLYVKSSKGAGTYAPVVSYSTEDGKILRYRSSSSSNPPEYKVGEIVDVYYNPKNTDDVLISGFFNQWGGITILGFIGLIFTGIGIGAIIYNINHKKKIEILKSTGIPIDAEFQKVVHNKSLKVNGRNPYVIYATWMDYNTNTLRTFKSDNIWLNPKNYISSKYIKIFIDQAKPKNYYMDISFLPKETKRVFFRN